MDELDKDDMRRKLPRFQNENFDKNMQLVKRIEAFAKEKHCTPAQLLLAWILAQGKDIIPIPGMRRRGHLEDNIKSLEVKLNADDLQQINEIAPPNIASGARYPENLMNLSNR